MGLNLVGTVSLDGSGWEAGMKRVEAATHKTADVVKGLVVSAFGIYGIEQAIHKTIAYGERVTDMSRRVGVGVEAMQEFGYAARQNGAELEDLVGFIEKLNSARIDPKKLPSFEALGIGAPGNLPVEDLIRKLSENVRSRSSQEVIGPLRAIGGRGAGSMLAMLKDDMEELSAEAHRLGAIMSKEDAVALKHIGDQMKSLAQIMIVALAPAILFVFDAIMRAVNGFKADKKFWETFVDKSKPSANLFWKTLIGDAGGVSSQDKEGMKRLFAGFGKSFTEAGAESGDLLEQLNKDFDKKKAELLKKQLEIEEINRMPDFDPVTKEAKVHKSGQHYSDSFLKIGNFLGASRTPMERIAQEQTQLLRRIADNTSQWRRQPSYTDVPATPIETNWVGHL